MPHKLYFVIKMKKNSFIVLLLVGFLGFSQSDTLDFDRMVEAEMKSASSVQNLRVNPNTLNYDVTHHELRFTVNPDTTTPFISGVVTTTFRALSNMTTVTFDMATALVVSSVTMNNTSLTFTQSNYELNITMPTPLTTGNTATVTITYAGAPPQAEAAFTQLMKGGA